MDVFRTPVDFSLSKNAGCVDRRLLTHRADLACGLDFDNVGGKLGFYDTWVARDIAGRPFYKHPLYAPDATTANRFKRGLPAAVHCCWNGMAGTSFSVLKKKKKKLVIQVSKDQTLSWSPDDYRRG